MIFQLKLIEQFQSKFSAQILDMMYWLNTYGIYEPFTFHTPVGNIEFNHHVTDEEDGMQE